ncbi:MAG: Formate/nitrite transporter [Aureobasidium pullulans]|nr:MAG: Formate/nitrite transporter [Aureobasidium pullulans]
MARLPQQALSSFIKIYHQLLPSVQHSSVHQQVIFVILIIKIQISATARKRKEDKIFWPDRDLFPSQLAKNPLRAPNNEQKRKRSMIWLSSCRHSGRDLSLLPTTSRSSALVPAADRDGPSPAPNNEHYERCQVGAGVDVRTPRSTTRNLNPANISWIPSTELNVGYAFVNFTHPEHITNFVNAKVGKPWSLYGSTKRCEVSYATIQGIDCLLAKFRNSVIMEEAASCRPKLWYHHESDVLPDNRHSYLIDVEQRAPRPFFWSLRKHIILQSTLRA